MEVGESGTFSLTRVTPTAASTPTPTPTEASEAQPSIVGLWEGAEVWFGEESGITVEFVVVGEGVGGTIILHNGRSFALNSVSFDTPQVHFEIGGG